MSARAILMVSLGIMFMMVLTFVFIILLDYIKKKVILYQNNKIKKEEDLRDKRLMRGKYARR